MSFRQINTLFDEIKVYRDDLYPFLGGGNKGRKMEAIGKDVLKKNASAIVTTGGIQSNHCRAVAVFAAQNNLKCTLVLHGSQEAFNKDSGNAKVMRMSGSDIVFVKQASDIGSAMDNAMEKYKNEGETPYYIYGGGHTMEGGKAYIDAVHELKKYCDKVNWSPKYIFLASGTGSTQAGILAGLDFYNLPSKVIGISVGRKQVQAENVVSQYYLKLCENYHIETKDKDVIVLDDYLCGGYGKYNTGIETIHKDSVKDYGFMLDTCYTAKAFYGMLDYININEIDKSKVLFWHTGGVFNFLAE